MAEIGGEGPAQTRPHERVVDLSGNSRVVSAGQRFRRNMLILNGACIAFSLGVLAERFIL